MEREGIGEPYDEPFTLCSCAIRRSAVPMFGFPMQIVNVDLVFRSEYKPRPLNSLEVYQLR